MSTDDLISLISWNEDSFDKRKKGHRSVPPIGTGRTYLNPWTIMEPCSRRLRGQSQLTVLTSLATQLTPGPLHATARKGRCCIWYSRPCISWQNIFFLKKIWSWKKKTLANQSLQRMRQRATHRAAACRWPIAFFRGGRCNGKLGAMLCRFAQACTYDRQQGPHKTDDRCFFFQKI